MINYKDLKNKKLTYYEMLYKDAVDSLGFGKYFSKY